MPYTKISELPETFNKLPDGAKEIALNVINSALDAKDTEEESIKKAWGSVKKSYEQNKDGNWVKSEKTEEAKLESIDIPGVEILAVGTWHGVTGEVAITEQDLKDAVSSFDAIRSDKSLNYEPPIKLGHTNKQKLLQEDGLPAAGWISALKEKGGKLIADLQQVPKKISQLMESGAYKKRSAEFYRNYEIGGKKYPFVIKALALLGADVPAVKTISDIQALYTSEGLLDESKTPYEIALFEESLDKKVCIVRDAYWKQFRAPNPMGLPIDCDTGWVKEVYDAYIIVDKKDALFKIPYVISETGEPVFDAAQAVNVEMVYQEIKNTNTEETMSEKEIREALGLDEKTDLLGAVKSLKTRAESAATQLAEGEQLKIKVAKLEEDLKSSQQVIALKERDDRVSKAIASGKIAPVQKAWAEGYALSDPKGFDAFVSSAPKVVELGERGAQGGAPEEVQLTETETRLAEQMGVSREQLIATKKAEKEAAKTK